MESNLVVEARLSEEAHESGRVPGVVTERVSNAGGDVTNLSSLLILGAVADEVFDRMMYPANRAGLVEVTIARHVVRHPSMPRAKARENDLRVVVGWVFPSVGFPFNLPNEDFMGAHPIAAPCFPGNLRNPGFQIRSWNLPCIEAGLPSGGREVVGLNVAPYSAVPGNPGDGGVGWSVFQDALDPGVRRAFGLEGCYHASRVREDGDRAMGDGVVTAMKAAAESAEKIVHWSGSR